MESEPESSEVQTYFDQVVHMSEASNLPLPTGRRL